jgi:hypothetical protein
VSEPPWQWAGRVQPLAQRRRKGHHGQPLGRPGGLSQETGTGWGKTRPRLHH